MFLSIDIGGTNTRVATSEDGKSIINKTTFPTPRDFDQAIEQLTQTIKDISQNKVPDFITIGLAGIVDKDTGLILKTPHLLDWQDRPIKEKFEQKLNTRVFFENDAALAGLGEAIAGAGLGFRIVSYVTISTGIGGARIVNGKIDPKAVGFEPGHHVIDPHGKFWPYCGQTGCWESFGSGIAFEQAHQVKPEQCNDNRIWDEHARVVSVGLVNLILFWSPDVVILGGSVTKSGDKFIQPLIHYTQENLKIFKCPQILTTKLGDDNVLLGGMMLQSQKR